MHQHRQSRVSGVQSQLTVGQAKDSRYLELSRIGITHLKVLFGSLRLLLQGIENCPATANQTCDQQAAGRHSTAAAAQQVIAMVQ